MAKTHIPPKPVKPSTPQTELGKLFDTDDDKLIIARAREVVEIAKRPSLHLSIIFDSRVGKAVLEGHDSTGAPIAVEVAYQLIDAARQELTRLEVEERTKQEIAKRNASESNAEAES